VSFLVFSPTGIGTYLFVYTFFNVPGAILLTVRMI